MVLISDIWSNRQMLDFMGVAATIMTESGEREIMTIGMARMPGSHCAENIKLAIEDIVNRFDFDKRKLIGIFLVFAKLQIKLGYCHIMSSILGVSSDEGSAYVRLFKQLQNDELNRSGDENLDEFEFNLFLDDDDAEPNQVAGNLASSEVEQYEQLKQVNEALNEAFEENHQMMQGMIHRVGLSRTLAPSIDNNPVEYDENGEYDFGVGGGQPFKDLDIQLGTSKLPRYSCANHKANIAVRLALKLCGPIVTILIRLSKYASRMRKSVNLSRSLHEAHARLQCDSNARWSAALIMLQSFLKTYRKEAFPATEPCPVSREQIEALIQILMPAHRFSLSMQKNSSTIGDVLPPLKIMLSMWSR